MGDHYRESVGEMVSGAVFESVADLVEALPDRRERIATAALQGLLVGEREIIPATAASDAVKIADALIAKLDEVES